LLCAAMANRSSRTWWVASALLEGEVGCVAAAAVGIESGGGEKK
jgi:hypothetical protein